MSIDVFRNNFKGVKANRFKIVGFLPSKIGSLSTLDDRALEFYVKATQFPGESIGVVSLNYRGRPLRFSSERGYSDWVMQIYNSNKKSFDLRAAFSTWIDSMNSFDHTKMEYDLTSEWTVYFNEELGVANNWQQYAKLYNCFPVDISPVELTNDTPDIFSEFTVTMTFDSCEFKL